MAPLVRTGGSRHTGLAAPPHRNIQFILLITQVVLWFMVMVMEMVVLIVKQINVSEHMLFLVSINLITIVTILINVHNYRKNKKRM